MGATQKQLREGSVIGGQYQVERLLRAGDMGDIYSSRDLGRGNARVVVKILSSVASTPGFADSLSCEFSLLQRLRHPNLVRILDFGVMGSSGDLFLVEEQVDGKELYSGTEGFDVEKVFSLILELSKALQYLHARSIVHGSLKPSNVLVMESENGRERLKLMEFGLNHWTGNGRQPNGYSTPTYTAPEILLGGKPTASSDLYSLGTLMYQLLARKLPFEDEDTDFLIQKHLQGSVDMRPVERVKGGTKLAPLVHRLLEKDPAKRLSSVEEVIAFVSEVLGRDGLDFNIKELESHFSAAPLVGREKEMMALQERARGVLEGGRGWTVFISGEAGSGKTRCLEEMKAWALLEGWRVVEGTCGECEEATYGPYRRILAKTDVTDGEEIFSFEKPPRMPDAGGFDASSEFAAGQFRDLLTRELIRRLTEQPTMLFLHDFHWADEATSAVLDYLSSDIQAHPVLMCVSIRSGEEMKGSISRVMDLVVRQERGEILVLYPLAKESIKQLVAGMTGDSQLKETLGNWLLESVGGNPFYLEEMLKHLVEQGILNREAGKWKFVGEDLKKLEVPATVGAVLQRRLAQLPFLARELADWLALFHHAVTIDVLSAVMSRSAADIREALQELSHRQMIRIETHEAGDSVSFSHALIAEVIRADLPNNLHRKMHRKIAEIIEREYGVENHVHELAIHHIEGKSQALSVHCVLASAEQSRAEFSHENALRCYEHVFKNRSSLTEEQRCSAAIDATDTMFALGLAQKAIHLLQTEMRCNKSIGVELRARMHMQLALSYQHLGDLHMQEVCCKKGLNYFKNRPASETNLTKAMLWSELAFGAVVQSHPRQGLIYLNQALKACPHQNADALTGRIQNLSASLQRVACNLHGALAASKKAAAILSHSGESYLACSAFSTMGFILMGLGRFPHALEKHKQAVSLSEKSRSAVLRSQALGNLAECLCRMGRVQEALNIADHAAQSVCDSKNPAISYAFNTTLAEIKLAAGDYRGVQEFLKTLKQDGGHDLAFYTVGHVHYVSANFNFILGNFTSALKHIEKLCNSETCEAPFYEHELAEALKARILAERGLIPKALRQLQSLDRAVTKKHWPYQMCIIKMHIGEILIKQRQLMTAKQSIRNALRLAVAMQSIPLICHGHLLLGLVCSLLRSMGPEYSCHSPELDSARSLTDQAIEELQICCQMPDSCGYADDAWRAHAELCMIYKSLGNAALCFLHAKKAYELLCRLEDQIPSEMLPDFYGAFNRSQAKLELVRLIEAGSAQEKKDIPAVPIHKDENARILLRLSNAVNSIRELDPLLESILDQLIPAIDVEKAWIFLGEESTGKMALAKGRNKDKESLFELGLAGQGILETVCKDSKPLISADLLRDPRINKEATIPGLSGKLFCAPMKASGRVIGGLYASHASPETSLSESTINLFAAFCNLAAIAVGNARIHQYLKKEIIESNLCLNQSQDAYAEIVGESAAVTALRDRIRSAAKSPLDILITGESGTGKELVARAIYRTGRRKAEKFVPVDCGSLSESLAEAELFGYRKGAFTGAIENRQGLLEAAHRGIIFLDEISNLPYRLQAKLLRVFQEREIRRIGETLPRKIDIQVIAATNKDLLEEMKAGRFREDLFYRLKAMEIRVPPLRERSEDIRLLIEWFLKNASDQEGGHSKRFQPESMELLEHYSYPGNIRELKNIVAGSYYSTSDSSIGIGALPPEVCRKNSEEVDPDSNAAANLLYQEILAGKGSFESLVKEPYLQHQFGSSMVRGVIKKALKDTGGRYRDALTRLRIPDRSYTMTMQFLRRHKCILDYRPFRRNREK